MQSFLSWLRGPSRVRPERSRHVPPESNAADRATLAPAADRADTWSALEAQLPETPTLTVDQERVLGEVLAGVATFLQNELVDLQVVPTVALQIAELATMPDTDAGRLARLVERDPAMAIRVLNVSNSAVFNRGVEFVSVHDAVRHLGMREVASIAIGLSCRSLFDADAQVVVRPNPARWNRLYRHGMTTALAASSFYVQRHRRHSEDVFVGGLLHDIGKSVALRVIDQLVARGELLGCDDLVIDEAIHRLHQDQTIGIYEYWTMPRRIIALCAGHHRGTQHARGSDETNTILLASALQTLRSGPILERQQALGEAKAAAYRLQLGEAELRAFVTTVREFAESAQRFTSYG